MFMCCCWSQIMWKRRRRTQVLFLRVNMMPAGVIQQLTHNYHIYPLQITINMFLEVPLSWINCIKRRESENFLLVVVEKAITNSIFHSRPIFMSCDFCANYIVPRERIKYFFSIYILLNKEKLCDIINYAFIKCSSCSIYLLVALLWISFCWVWFWDSKGYFLPCLW